MRGWLCVWRPLLPPRIPRGGAAVLRADHSELVKSAREARCIVEFCRETMAPEPADEETVEMLALVIYQEAGGNACSDNTRRMVGEVALNRVEDSRFPDTLEGVLTQKAQYGRLYWTGLIWPERASYEGEKGAVERAYETARLILSSDERLLPRDVVFQAEFPQGSEVVVQADGLYFCR